MSYIKTPLVLNQQFTLQPEFVAASCNVLVKQCHEANVAAGWWTKVENQSDSFQGANVESVFTSKAERNVGELLMLAVSELSEAMEGDRKNLADDKLPQYAMIDVEIADCMIRLCDLAGARSAPLGEIMAAKMAYNIKREDHTLAHRAGIGGKQY